MKLLVATALSQGVRANDYHWAIEGELVWDGIVCAKDLNDPDGGCGCGRGFAGMNSHLATTTAMVRELTMTREDVVTALAGYYEAGGYGVLPRESLRTDVDDMERVIARWPVGSILERRLDVFQLRHPLVIKPR